MSITSMKKRITRASIVTAGIAAFASTSAAQQQPSMQMVLKGKAPVNNEPLKVTLPKPKQAVLANGAKLMVIEDHRLPQVSFQIIIPGAGGYYDPAEKVGLANFTAAIMREGTKTRSSSQISEALETMGASLTVGSGLSSTTATISGSSLVENFPKLMDLAADILLNPAFSKDEWERYRSRSKAGLVQQRTSPDFLASEMLNRVVFGSHPAGRTSTTAAALDAVTIEDLAAFHRTHFVPDNAVIAFAGDITLADAQKLVNERFASWKQAGSSKVQPVTDPAPITGAPKILLISRPNSVQTTLYVGTQGLKRTDADYTALTVVNRVLGGTMGRLFRHLREEKGYTYGIGSGLSASPFVGQWISNTSVRTDVTEPALRDLLDEIAQLRNTPVPASELTDAKHALVASFALSLESTAQVLQYYLDTWRFGLSPSYWDNYPAAISNVTAAQAQAAAKKYWDPSRLQIVAVGDASKIKDILAKMGTVEVYDAEGKRVE